MPMLCNGTLLRRYLMFLLNATHGPWLHMSSALRATPECDGVGRAPGVIVLPAPDSRPLHLSETGETFRERSGTIEKRAGLCRPVFGPELQFPCSCLCFYHLVLCARTRTGTAYGTLDFCLQAADLLSDVLDASSICFDRSLSGGGSPRRVAVLLRGAPQ